MKLIKKGALAVTLAAALVAGAGVTAMADSAASKAARVAVTEAKKARLAYRAELADYKADKSQTQAEYKAALKLWKEANADLRAAKKAVNDAFRAGMKAAIAARDAVLNSETATDEEKAAAEAAFTAKVKELTAAKKAALAALKPVGNPPAKPVKAQPTKAPKPTNPAKGGKNK